MKVAISDILRVIKARMKAQYQGPKTLDTCIGISIDTRTLIPGEVFFALKGGSTDGHQFVTEAINKGAALLVLERAAKVQVPAGQGVLYTDSPLQALQHLASWYRQQMYQQVLAVTGSNGKTIFKDTLKKIFSKGSMVASPGSYNGALGLPLSILLADEPTELGIFEVGIAAPNEMATLEEIVKPNFGVLTNIGMSHIAAFDDRQHIANEKIQLFANIDQDGWVLVPELADEPLLSGVLALDCQIYQLGRGEQGIKLDKLSHDDQGTVIQLISSDAKSPEFKVHTSSPEIIIDIHFAASAAFLLGVSLTGIAEALAGYEPSPTRMEVWSSPTGIKVINDSHSSDPISVGAALKAAAQMSKTSNKNKRIFVFSGMRELGDDSIRYHERVGILAAEYGFTHLYVVHSDTPELQQLKGALEATVAGFKHSGGNEQQVCVVDVKQLRERLLFELASGDVVLYKGPRACGMTTAANDLIGSIAQRCLWIDLTAIKENIAQIRRRCNGARVMAMLKALSYGTDLEKIAYWAVGLGINSIGVSAVAEGVSLRRAGYSDDIFVFLSDKTDIDEIVFNNLTPILYSRAMVDDYCQYLAASDVNLNVHLKVDTGMHRLGVSPHEALELAQQINHNDNLTLTGVCTHLAAADEPAHDDFTNQQLDCFDGVKAELIANGFDQLIFHAENSAAAIRLKRPHYDMVRLGLALYGLYTSPWVQQEINLSLAIGVTSRVIDIRSVSPNQTIGYAREFKVSEDMRIACVPFGYADGLPWSMAKGNDSRAVVNIGGHELNIVGRISMDQLLVDVTGQPEISIGDEVLIYGCRNGHTLRPEDIAERSGMIPHELLIRLGKRVQRIFMETS